jgi:hypothetical protein
MITIRIFFGIFFLSAAALMFEVALSRLLAIRFWHHYAFLIISCALLGYSMSGLWLLLVRRPRSFFMPSFIFTITIIPLLIVFQLLPFDPTLISLEHFQWAYLFLHYIILALPFFFCGLTINRLLQEFSDNAFTLYSGDLMGAAIGTLGFFITASHLKEMEWLIVVTVFGAISSVCFATNVWNRLAVGTIIIVLLISLIKFGIPEWKMSPYKSLPLALQQYNSELIETRSDAVSRVDWFKSPVSRSAPGLSLDYSGRVPEQTGITIDGDLLTSYIPWTTKSREYIHYLPSWILYELNPQPKKVLIIQVVGGKDVLVAKEHGVENIVAQTDYKIIADWLKRESPWSDVKIHSERVRTFLAGTDDLYDRIVVSLEGALPTGASGTDALQEGRLETEEGVISLLNHLSPNGWLSIHRYLLPPPRSELRWISTFISSMEKIGWNPSRQLGVFRTISTIMVLVSSQQWSPEQRLQFKQFTESRSFTPVYYPGMTSDSANKFNRFPSPVYADAVQGLLADRYTFIKNSIYDLKPVIDDKPYFYDFLRFSKLRETYESLDRKWEGLLEGGLLLPLLLLQVLFIVCLFLILPLLVCKRSRNLLSWQSTYFLWIGLGFMCVEIGMFQKLMMFLGEPVYSFAVVLSGLLLALGIGSASGRYLSERRQVMLYLGLVAGLIIYYLVFSKLLGMFSGTIFPIRLAVSLALTAILGIMMGIPFPRGIIGISKQYNNKSILEDNVSLAWCFNGMGSVIGPVLALLLIQVTGIASLFLWAALCYVLAYYVFISK